MNLKSGSKQPRSLPANVLTRLARRWCYNQQLATSTTPLSGDQGLYCVLAL
jgi:hypothetical protein